MHQLSSDILLEEADAKYDTNKDFPWIGSRRPITCCVKNCGNTTENYLRNFHSFPGSDVKFQPEFMTRATLDRFNKWKEATKVEIVDSTTCVCHSHFEENDYYENFMPYGEPRLKEAAVPALNLPDGDRDENRNDTLDLKGQSKGGYDQTVYAIPEDKYIEDEDILTIDGRRCAREMDINYSKISKLVLKNFLEII